MGRPKGSTNHELGAPPVGTGKPPSEGNTLYIENLPVVIERVKADMEEKKQNPSVVHEEDAGLVFKEGEPYRIINDQYVKNDEAVIILQTRKVVREYLKLQELKDKVKRGLV
jgi:hypothetical protein